MILKRHKQQRGFILLEIILAISLFAVVATAMVVALDRLADSAITARKEAACLKRLESVMTEVRHSPSERTGVIEFPAEGNGVAVTVEIVPEVKTNERGQPLTGLFRVIAIAEIGDDYSRTMETLILRK